MEALFFYFLKVVICSGVMFLYYLIFLKDKTFHHYNRFYLLSVLAISLILPFIKINDFTIEVSPNLFVLLQLLYNGQTLNNTTDGFNIYQIIFGSAFLVSLFFSIKFILSLLKLQKLKKDFPQESLEGISFYNTDLENAPFSFFKNLFWKKSILLNSDLGKQILKHEMVHIEQKHSYDKIANEIITALFWFNPFFHLIKKELHLIHEYLADKKTLKNADAKAFARILIETHFSGAVLPGTSPFLNSNLKKRIIMLKKSNTKFSYLRKILALPLLFTLVFTYMVRAENHSINETNRSVNEVLMELSNSKKVNDTLKKPVEMEQMRADAEQAKADSKQTISDAAQAKADAKQASVDAAKANLDSRNAWIESETAQKGSLRAKIAAEKAAKARSEAEKEGLQSMINQQIFNKSSENPGSAVKITRPLDKAIIYIDGVKSDDAQFKDINPQNIESVNVIGNKTPKELHIKTKNGAQKSDNPWLLNVEAHAPKNEVKMDKLKDKKTSPYTVGDPYIAPPQSKYKIMMNYPEGNVSSKTKLMLDFANSKADIYINGKKTDKTSINDIDPETIKDVNVIGNTDGSKEIRIQTKN